MIWGEGGGERNRVGCFVEDAMGADTRDNGSIYLARQLERNEVENNATKGMWAESEENIYDEYFKPGLS